ncbi:MAG: biotin carboxylase N-terminal domain-containing protein [Myxococcota bacterium]|nr:biotin carboxylase N-terminal domain-containing protein [Myxococcota bacterium]
MFRKILIANRGEVACRVIRATKKMGIQNALVFSEPDASLQYIQDADDARCIGGPRSYLDATAILNAAREMGCSAIHPGWGFLSENPTFAARCEALGITFVGPRPLSMRQMSDKAMARSTMRKLGLPPIPGVDRSLYSVNDAKEAAKIVGYPLLLKAVAGGGGRGMRKVFSPDKLEEAFVQASAEARSAFGNGAMYMERLIVGGRHIEFQVLCDGKNAIILGERECSIQRRHQKLLEETPSPAVSNEQRKQLSEKIKSVVESLGYRGAGTMEMLRDRSGEIFFMEMNPRLQVEHTITEETWGVDLVEQQFKIAANHPLSLDASPNGHSIQCRINAERVEENFKPTPGRIDTIRWPDIEGVRVDTHLRSGDKISPFYDSMLAKVICWAEDRPRAIEKMKVALRNSVIEGVPSTIDFHLRVLDSDRFQSGDYDTKFIEEELLS